MSYKISDTAASVAAWKRKLFKLRMLEDDVKPDHLGFAQVTGNMPASLTI